MVVHDGAQLRSVRDVPLAYPVYVGRGIVDSLGDIVREHAPGHRIALIVDETVANLHANRLRAAFGGHRVDLLRVPPGEQEKSREQWARLTDELCALDFGRDSTVVAVGGGVVCDLAGFVAATFMRGIPVVQVPTTLLSMVDASVGGKTAVDIPAGKNLVGAFHDPSAVVADVALLDSLPAVDLRVGLAEVLKHGIIADRRYFEATLQALPDIALHGAASDSLAELIAGSIRIKASVVAKDAREKGLRHILNFGHTIAHAIEHCSRFAVRHGDAVAVGMIVEARIAERLKLAAPGTCSEVSDAVRRAGLPSALTDLGAQLVGLLTPQQLVDATRHDKKSLAGAVRYALPRCIGTMEPGDGRWSVAVPDDVVLGALA